MDATKTILFVYGTLKRGQKNHGLLADQEFLGAAISAPRYRVFDLGDYPGMVRDDQNSLNSTGVVTGSIQNAPAADADKVLGMLNVNILDENRATLRALPYQHYDQSCGYFPDSTAAAFDKRNVRDGHYPLWAPIHLYALANNGVPTSPSVKRFINLVLGTEEIEGLDPIAPEATPPSHLIPQCAMRVRRTEDGGALASFAPESPCGCRFEALAGGSTTCQPCSTSDTCPTEAPRCSYGYCEP